ncbi:MAG: hypothetical protein R3E98_21200 [Gemmatimonadota bacterium]|nr:hypothetical protein [Gemmatimonadota bacterium]
MEDQVAIDAKRILLRYGAPIAILDKIAVKERIAFARQVTRTALAERGPRLKELLAEGGYLSA